MTASRPVARLQRWALCAALAMAGWATVPAPRVAGQEAASANRGAGVSDPHDRMQLRRTDHFLIAFQGPAQTSLSSSVLEVLESAYWRIGGALAALPIRPIPVVLYTSEPFRDVTRAPSWVAGAFDGIIRIPMRGALDNPRELERVLSHEYTHALVWQLCPRPVPVWLNEGLATALEANDVEWARLLVRRAGRAAPLDALQRPFRSLTGEQAAIAYASSALAAQRLLEEAGGLAVANLLRDVGQGRDFDLAFAHRIQRSVAAFQAELNGAP